MIESPKVGDCVRVIVDGTVERVFPHGFDLRLPAPDQTLLQVSSGEPYFHILEIITPPDPWQPGDIVIDASGSVWQRGFGSVPVWYSPGREDPVSQDRLAAPLTLLVRDGHHVTPPPAGWHRASYFVDVPSNDLDFQ